MESKNNYKMLVIGDSTAEADLVVNQFRRAQLSVASSYVDSVEKLIFLFNEQKDWNIILINNWTDQLNQEQLMENLTEYHSIDIPLILLSSTAHDVKKKLEWLNQGGTDIVDPANHELLLHIVQKEVENFMMRRNYSKLSIVLAESERQRQFLLDDEKDPLVYVAHDKIGYANPAFCSIIGLEKLVPHSSLTDYIVEEEQKDVSEFLRVVESTSQPVSVMQCQFIKADQSTLPVRIIIRPSVLNGEFCSALQILPIETKLDAKTKKELQKVAHINGLQPKEILSEQIDVALKKTMLEKGHFALMRITIFDYDKAKLHYDQTELADMDQQLLNILQLELAHLYSFATFNQTEYIVLIPDGDKTLLTTIASNIHNQYQASQKQTHKIDLVFTAAFLTDSASTDAMEQLLFRLRNLANRVTSEEIADVIVQFYKPRKVTNTLSSEHHFLVKMITHAFKTKASRILFKPIVSLAGDLVERYEVLFEIKDIRNKLHTSDKFYNKISNNPLWHKIDCWQMYQALQVLRESDQSSALLWFQLGHCELEDIGRFNEFINNLSIINAFNHKQFIFSISEIAIASHKNQAINFFKQLKSLGFQVAISDFGGRVDPLDMLTEVKVDWVKVAPAMIEEYRHDNPSRQTTQLLTSLMEYGVHIVGDSVDSTQLLSSLWHAGIAFAQGDFINPPMKNLSFNFSE